MSITPQLRPLGIGDLFDAAFRLYRERFWRLIAISALVFVPTAVLRWMLWTRLFASLFDIWAGFRIFGVYATSFLSDIIWSLTFGNLLNGVLITAISHAYLGRTIGIIAAYRAGIGRYGTLVAASIVPLIIYSLARPIPSLLGLLRYGWFGLFLAAPSPAFQNSLQDLTVILFCLAVLLGLELLVLLLYSYFLLVPQVVVLEDKGPRAALSRSWGLVAGSARRALGIVIATGILGFLVGSLPPMLLFVFPFGSFNASYPLFSGLLGIVALAGQILVQPILLAIFTLFYYDQRVRKEGYDLELLVQQVAG